MLQVTSDDFALAFGVAAEDLPADCRSKILEHDFRFEPAPPEEHSRLVLETLKTLDGGELVKVGSHRKAVWERGWSENLREFVAADYNLESLLPKYYNNAHPYLRLRRQYIKPVDPSFEVNFYTVLRMWLFRRYLTDIQNVYELGAGTGLNLAMLAQLFPEKNLYGLDWASASKDILTALSKRYGWRITGYEFDLFHPDPDFELAQNSAVLTTTALEQLGHEHGPLLDYLLRQAPAVCINVEPIVELYQDEHLLDSLAMRYHRQRGYLENYLPTLRQLEQEGKIELLCVQRPYFGGFFNESYSIVVWKPRAAR